MNFLYVIRQNRRRLWGVFCACAVAYLVYELVFVREYTAFSQVRAIIWADKAAQSDAAPTNQQNQELASFEQDFAAHVQLVQSAEFLQGMSDRLTDEDRKDMLAPLTHWLGTGQTAGEVLLERRRVSTDPSLKIIDLGFQHPNPAVAVRTAKELAAEFVRQSEALNEAQKRKVLGDLPNEVDTLGKKVETLQSQLSGYANKYGLAKLDSGGTADVFSTLQELSRKAVDDKAAVDKLNAERQQIQQEELRNEPLWNLSFIANQPHVQQLISDLQGFLTRRDQLRQEQYADDSQPMVELIGRINNTATELANAAEVVSKQIASDYEAAATTLDKTTTRLDAARTDAQDLATARDEYAKLHQDLDATQKLLSAKTVELSDQTAKVNLALATYALLPGDEPTAQADSPAWVQFILRALGAGVAGSLLLALGLTFFRPPPVAERREHERRRRRHRSFQSSTRRR